jgi:hypothetical protein
MPPQHRSRHYVIAIAVAAGAFGLAACSGSSQPASSVTTAPSTAAVTSSPSTTSTTALPTTTVATGPADLGAPQVTAAHASSALGTGELNASVRDQVVAAVHAYENAATGTPLGTGQAANVDPLLTAGARARLTPTSRAALTDEGMPPVGAIKATTSTVSLDGFAGPDQTMVVNATVDLQVSASSPAGAPATVKRTGTLTFVDDFGSWKIDAFNLAVERQLP